MENHVNQSPAIPKWSALLIEAVTKPGLIMKAYSAFHAYAAHAETRSLSSNLDSPATIRRLQGEQPLTPC
jgi:hypothetical protein